MSDEELERRLEAVLREMSEEDVRAMAQEYPHFFTPEVLEKELARWGWGSLVTQCALRLAPQCR